MQIALYPFGEGGFYFAPLDLRLNIYTAPGFLGLIMAIVNMVAVCVWFKETEVDIYDGQKDYKVDIGELLEVRPSSARYSLPWGFSRSKHEGKSFDGQDMNLHSTKQHTSQIFQRAHGTQQNYRFHTY